MTSGPTVTEAQIETEIAAADAIADHHERSAAHARMWAQNLRGQLVKLRMTRASETTAATRRSD